LIMILGYLMFGAFLWWRAGFPDLPLRKLLTSPTTLALMILVPVVEEVFFRKFVGLRLRLYYRLFFLVLLSAWFFTLVHAVPSLAKIGDFDLPLFPGVFLLGLFTQAMFFNTRSLLLCILIHSLANASGLFIADLAPDLIEALPWFYSQIS